MSVVKVHQVLLGFLRSQPAMPLHTPALVRLPDAPGGAEDARVPHPLLAPLILGTCAIHARVLGTAGLDTYYQ